MLTRISLIIIILLVAIKSFGQTATFNKTPKSNPRLIILTDMTSIEAGVREPDDAQSMIRLMLYANEFDIQGLIASSGLGDMHGKVVHPDYIKTIVEKYGKVRPNLLLHDSTYPKAKQLKQVIKSGQPIAGRDTPVFDSIGKGKDTEGSDWIIQKVDEASANDPIWILAWGGPADLAQALWKVRETRSPQELAEFIAKIRVRTSGDQDSTGPWIKSQFPDVYYVTGGDEQRGFYRGGDTTLVSSQWVQQNIKGHGALGDLYPNYDGGDTYSWKIGGVTGIKSGDAPTFTALISNGLNVFDRPTWLNWGGRRKQDNDNPHRYHDAIDSVANYQTDISPYLAAVYRWRPAFQAEFQARLDWCTQPYAKANHVPENSTPKIIKKSVTAGEKINLHAQSWKDPDGDRLTYHWQVLPEESSYSGDVKIENSNSQSAHFTVPSGTGSKTVHVLFTVTDNGSPALSSYQRYHYTVKP